MNKKDLTIRQNSAPVLWTVGSGMINIIDPEPSHIDLEDIARGLGFSPHFGGLTPRFFSIAEHCCLAAKLHRLDYFSQDATQRSSWVEYYQTQLIILLHDAAEAYLGDIKSPIKALVPKFKEIEDNLQEFIFRHFYCKMSLVEQRVYKKYDLQAQQMEAVEFYGLPHREQNGIEYWSPETARLKLLNQIRNVEINLKRYKDGTQ